jgi:hypothetical protein
MGGDQAEDEAAQPMGEDTAAFRRFYLGVQSESPSLLYRLFVGWWRDKGR